MPASAPRPQTERQPSAQGRRAAASENTGSRAPANSPLSATVVAIEVQLGQQVTEGQQVVVLEAMKMHSSLRTLTPGP